MSTNLAGPSWSWMVVKKMKIKIWTQTKVSTSGRFRAKLLDVVFQIYNKNKTTGSWQRTITFNTRPHFCFFKYTQLNRIKYFQKLWFWRVVKIWLFIQHSAYYGLHRLSIKPTCAFWRFTSFHGCISIMQRPMWLVIILCDIVQLKFVAG